MTKTKRSRPRRGGGPRKLRPTSPPQCRLRARRYQRAERRSEKFVVCFEHLGEYYDDVLVTLEYDKRAVTAIRELIRELPPWAGRWDTDFKVWRIHPGYADRLAADLKQLGYTIRGRETIKEPQVRPTSSLSQGNSGQQTMPHRCTQKAPDAH
jgi:hypothetical protein